MRSAPKYRKHKGGQAFVRIGKKDVYLGVFGSPESRDRYHQVLAEQWHPTGPVAIVYPTIAELAEKYLAHARSYYADSDEAEHLDLAIRPLLVVFGDVPTDEFRPVLLDRFRDRMVHEGRTRQGINKQVNRIRRVFRWGVSQELVPPRVLDTLAALPPLARGRTAAPESEKIDPVPESDLRDTLDHATPIVGAMIQVQLLTACRPGEPVRMSRDRIDTSGDVWEYSPATHKNQWRDHGRQIHIGPRAQEILREYLPADVTAPIFSPRRFYRNARFRDAYDVRTYRVAVWTACDNAGVPRWSPNRLRHNRATDLRERFGIEAAQASLGHSRVDTTTIYAERNRAKSIEIARSVG